MKLKTKDSEQIDIFINEIIEEYKDGLYFNEFI